MSSNRRSQFKDVIRQIEGTILPADIIGTDAGQLGHAQGVVMVPAGNSDEATILVSCVIINDKGDAAYGGGGNLTVNISAGGAAVTGIAASFDTASSDTVMQLVPLAADKITYTLGHGLALVDSGAPTGTHTGKFRYIVRYQRVKVGMNVTA